MTLTIAAEPVPLRLDSSGTYRVGGTRVRLDTVVFAYNSGSSAEQIVHDFPSLALADVHSVLGYYLHHRNEVDAYLSSREEEAARIRAEVEAVPHNKELREKLISRRNPGS
jgi:uncharacterized protein (DUF433 family)